MKRSLQIKNEVDKLKRKIAEMKNEGLIKEAHAKLEELDKLNNELKEAELEERLAAQNFNPTPAEPTPKNKISANTVFNKLVLGKAVTEEEMAVYNVVGQQESLDEKGGYIVPIERFKEIIEEKRKRVSLKQFCNVVPVKTNKGTAPTSSGDGELLAFDELAELGKSDIDFGQIKYETKDYGDIIPVSNSLLADTDVNLIAFIKKRFGKKAVNTENKKILALMAGAAKVAGTDWKAILTCLNKELDPAISANSIIITNQTSFDWLDGLVGADGRPLLTQDLTNAAIMRFRGRQVVVLPDGVLAPTDKMDFYIGDLEEAINFYDRQAVSIAVSTEAGFVTNTTLLRAIERFDVKAVDAEAIKHVEITVGKAK